MRFFGMTTAQFLKFARGTVRSYRALANWVRRNGRKGISPVKAEVRRKRLDVKARAVLQVADLRRELLEVQQGLTLAIAKRRAELLTVQEGLSQAGVKKRHAQAGKFFTLRHLR
jgi:hypothetical protein